MHPNLDIELDFTAEDESKLARDASQKFLGDITAQASHLESVESGLRNETPTNINVNVDASDSPDIDGGGSAVDPVEGGSTQE